MAHLLLERGHVTFSADLGNGNHRITESDGNLAMFAADLMVRIVRDLGKQRDAVHESQMSRGGSEPG